MSDIDFLPERIRLQRQRLAHLKRQGLLLLLCIAAMAGLTCHAALSSIQPR